MQKSIWKVLVLFLTLAAPGRQVSAAPTPTISQLSRLTQAEGGFDQFIRDSDSTSSLGPVDLSASVSIFRSVGEAGSDYMILQSSQHSTVDAFGFSYESSIEVSTFGHGLAPAGSGDAVSVLRVTYVLDEPFAYEFTLTRGGSVGTPFDSLPFSGPFPTSGVLQPGSYTFQVGDIQTVFIYIGGSSSTVTETATLRLSPLSVLDTDGDGVPDSEDVCPDTPAGANVDAQGCSIDQLVPCAGPRTGGTWRNQGEYVSAVTRTAEAFLAAGLITEAQKDAAVRAAAQSDCGKGAQSVQ
jgi:hypothetical protein